MSQEPQAPLPSYYGERTPDGRIVKRPSSELPDMTPLKSPPPRTSSEQLAPLSSNAMIPEIQSPSEVLSHQNSFSGPRAPNAIQRWGPLSDPRASEHAWRSTPSKRRLGDEFYYPDYQGPERRPYHDYDDEHPLRRNGTASARSLREYPGPGALVHRNVAYAERPHDAPSPRDPRVPRQYSENSYDYPTSPGGNGFRGPPSDAGRVLRLPLIWWMNSDAKNHFVAAVGEFVGTFMFLFFAFSGTQVANIGSQDNTQNSTTGESTGFDVNTLQYIALVFAFSLMVNVWIFFRISGGLFNPAVTFAMVMVKAVSIPRGLLLVCSQLVGSIFASYIVSVLFPTEFNVRTTLSDGTSTARGLFIEAFLTAELVFTIFMLAKEKHKATFIAPVGIGLALFIGELVGVYYTGGSLNPARSFGPCVVNGQWDSEHWIYWLGPALGAVLAVLFYEFIKMLEYEMANPGQDAVHEEEAKHEAESLKNKESKISLAARNRADSIMSPPKKRYTGDA
ncbi:mip family channel protein [Diplodia corticola]|uniref:Mip family channel protein n=1 Tax=Diplodia corticola TaxID=236234 RepID=A0A1J9R5B3_9PEZI|nr:mip family channel protein [Diplodia corticola]OJD35792.1 mip family channel protein [Diplodia corticola]